MRLVLDNNIFFSMMKPESTASQILLSGRVVLSAPDFIIKEFNKHKELCIRKSGLSKKKFEMRYRIISSKISFVEFDSYKHYFKQALDSLSDKKDSPYLALALATRLSIWSNDRHLLKQPLIRVFSTKEVVELLEET